MTKDERRMTNNEKNNELHELDEYSAPPRDLMKIDD